MNRTPDIHQSTRETAITRASPRRTLLLTVALWAGLSTAHADILDFGSGPAAPSICTGVLATGEGPASECSNGSFVSQGYGDVAGLVDISYVSPPVGDAIGLRWWGPDYNNLYGVLYAGNGGDSSSLARIEIKAAAPDAVVTLTGFDLGAYSQTTRDTNVKVYAIGGGTPLYSFSGPVGNGALSATSFSVSVSAVGGLWLEWGNSAFNVGIDNVQYSVSSVPEPAPAALMLVGGMMGLLALRRRRAAR